MQFMAVPSHPAENLTVVICPKTLKSQESKLLTTSSNWKVDKLT